MPKVPAKPRSPNRAFRGRRALWLMDGWRHAQGVLVNESVVLAVPLGNAQIRFHEFLRMQSALQAICSTAFQLGQQSLVLAGLSTAAIDIVAHNLPLYWRGNTAVVLMRWWTTEQSLDDDPPLDASLELGPLATTNSLLALRGSYHPPLPPSSLAGDAVLLAPATQLTCRRLLEQLARVLDPSQALPPGPTWQPAETFGLTKSAG